MSATKAFARWWVSLATASILTLAACSGVSVIDTADAEPTHASDDRNDRRDGPADAQGADARDSRYASSDEAAVLSPAPVSRDNAPEEIAVAADWTLLPAAAQADSWIGRVESTASEIGWWHGGDGNISIQLPDGQIWHIFSDTYTGLVDPDFSRGSAGNHLVYNSIVIRDADGQFLGQVWDEQIGTNPPGNTAAIVPDQDKYPDNFYWLAAGAVIEEGELRVLAALMQKDPLQRVDTHILTLDTDRGSVADVTPTRLTAADFSPAGAFEDAGWFYVHGQRPTVNTQDGWAMLRAPVGSFRYMATWQAWDGLSWNSDLAAHAPIQGTDGQHLPTYGIYYSFRASPDGFLALAVPMGGDLSIYRSERPQGPYEHIGTLPTETAEKDEEFDGIMGAYAPSWHPHYDTDDGLMVSYATNYFSKPDDVDTERDNGYYMPNYAIVPKGMVDGFANGNDGAARETSAL